MHQPLTQALNWIRQQESHCIEQLIAWCNIHAGSTHLEGLQHMHQQLAQAFASLADQQQTLDSPPRLYSSLLGEKKTQVLGSALYCQKRPHLTRRILLCGHMDTVFPPSSPFRLSQHPLENRLVGPGVADMKGGLMIMLTALQAFERTPAAETLGWDVFINADEEVGSLASQHHLCAIAKQAQAALVFEPALDEIGTLARARKGCGHFTIHATGKAAHAGRDFHAGKNAIMLLANALIAIHKLNQQNASFTINIGLIQGGEALNQVPDKAGAKLEIRVENPKKQVEILQQLQHICDSLSKKDAELTLEGQFHRPIKLISPQTERLFLKLQHAAGQLNLTRHWQDSGGCCDGNNLAALGVPVLDTLGMRGGQIHTEQEYACIDSLVEQASLTLLLLHDLASGGLEQVTS